MSKFWWQNLSVAANKVAEYYILIYYINIIIFSLNVRGERNGIMHKLF